jgi:hypothetical protein
MVDPNEPTKQTNSDGLPLQPMAQETDLGATTRETVRIQLPSRESSLVADAVSLGPKQDMARIPLTPQPPSRPLPTIQMKKTQPLIAMPQLAPESASIPVAFGEESAADAIPMPLCWLLLGVSTVVLVIQIWTYIT